MGLMTMMGVRAICFCVIFIGAVASAQERTCVMENGRNVTVVIAGDGEPCRFGVEEGRMRGAVCRIQNPQLRRLTLDATTGALVYEDTDNDAVKRGSCPTP
ncbi:MAG: hypothetical protein AAGB11_05610 [Pseudomonadota bacterium]